MEHNWNRVWHGEEEEEEEEGDGWIRSESGAQTTAIPGLTSPIKLQKRAIQQHGHMSPMESVPSWGTFLRVCWRTFEMRDFINWIFFFNKMKRTVESVRDGATWIISGSEMGNRTCDQFRGTRGSHVEQVWVEQLRELEKRSRGWGNKKWNRRTGWIQDVNNAKVFSCKKQLRNRQHLHISRSTFCFQTGKWDDALFSVSGYLNEFP